MHSNIYKEEVKKRGKQREMMYTQWHTKHSAYLPYTYNLVYVKVLKTIQTLNKSTFLLII